MDYKIQPLKVKETSFSYEFAKIAYLEIENLYFEGGKKKKKKNTT